MRGGAYYSDAACECINAIYNNKKIHMVVSTQNRGAISELPVDSIVEVSSIIDGKGATPIAWGKFPSAQRGWLQCMKAMEECTINAAVTGNYGMAMEAFALNPLIPSGESAKQVLDQLLLAHEESMKMLSGFGSGMYTGLTCGALIGCTAVLSKLLIQTKAHDQLDTFRPIIQTCIHNFKEELHDTECRNIRKTWYDPKLHCVHTVQAAGKALEKTINELHNT